MQKSDFSMGESSLPDEQTDVVKLNALLKDVWQEAAISSSNRVNVKLVASSFFLLGMAVGDVKNWETFHIALTEL
jgi:hypothetical protein